MQGRQSWRGGDRCAAVRQDDGVEVTACDAQEQAQRWQDDPASHLVLAHAAALVELAGRAAHDAANVVPLAHNGTVTSVAA